MNIRFLQANNGDSILLSFTDDDGVKRNILIDGGMPQSYYNSSYNIYGDLYNTIEELKVNEEVIDLLVLTHIDEDHIGGILNWFSMDKEAFKMIKKVWFNSGTEIANYFNEKENEDLNLLWDTFETNETSVRQGKKFEKYIIENSLWDKAIVKCGTIENFNGIDIKVLSPNDLLLEKLLKEHKNPRHKYFTDDSENDWGTDIAALIAEEDLSSFKFEKDTSVTNGSSIAFLLSFNNRNFLFLGDSHPHVIIDSLKLLDEGYSKENPIKVELLKISHHGSSKNTNKELLEVIETDNYVISTSSEFHNHPNKRTIARIIKRNPNATIYFNYDEVRGKIFSKQDYIDFPHLLSKNTTEYSIKWE